MTVRIAYVGAEANAAGYRLAGARSCVPAPGAVAPAVAEAGAKSDVVLLSAACAQRLPPALIESWVSRISPLLIVIPDAPLEDVGAALRRELGIEP